MHDLAHTVQTNCHISDARFAGNHTLCVFLLKMREYYRWERGLSFTDSLSNESVGDWLADRERLWETLGEQPFQPLSVAGQELDPFDSDAVNAQLDGLGLVYSGGYGRWCKPLFFLGRVREAMEIQGYPVIVSDQELARDLVAPPAMSQGQRIYVRRESLRRMLWEKVEEWRWHKDASTVPAVMRYYDFATNLEQALDQMTEAETYPLIRHEVGEAEAGEMLGPDWEEMLASLPRGRAEVLVRAVRDHLADALSTLPALLERDAVASLHFYYANLTGMRRELFPHLVASYKAWANSGALEVLAAAVAAAREHWSATAREILEHYRADQTTCASRIEAMEKEMVF